jgi:proteasome lid subunit RPN8/RPN11
LDKVLFEIVCSDELLAQIEEHCFSQTRTEVGGFLVGEIIEGKSVVTNVIKAKHTAAQMTQLTFTHKTWDAAFAEMAKIKPDAKLIGWYHSHPNFGVFLSDHDKFIQTQFFSTDGSVTIVVDPIRGKRGWFISRDKEVVPYAKEEDTTLEKLGESASDPDENIPSIAAKQSAGGIGLGRVLAISAIFSLLSMFGGFTLANTSNNSSEQIANLERQLNYVLYVLQENGLSVQPVEPEPVAPADPTAPVAPTDPKSPMTPASPSTAPAVPKSTVKSTTAPQTQPGKTVNQTPKKTKICYSKTGKAKQREILPNLDCPKGFQLTKPTIISDNQKGSPLPSGAASPSGASTSSGTTTPKVPSTSTPTESPATTPGG